MNWRSERECELDRLLSHLCDDVLTADEVAKIEALVMSSDELRTRYVRYVELHSIAERREWSQTTVSRPAADAFVSLKSPVLVRVGEFTTRLCTLMPTLFVAVLVYGLFGLLVLQMGHDRSTLDRSSHVTDRAATSDTSWESKPIARLVRATDCRWHPGIAPLVAGSSLAPSTIELVEGTAEVEFADGAQTLLKAPIELELISPGRAFVRSGQLIARVPQRAIGFCISTPTVEVVDLGTEFGVNVSKQGVVEVAVVTGKVEIGGFASRIDHDGLAGIEKRIISAGEAVNVVRSPAGTLTIDRANYGDTSTASLSKQLRATKRALPRVIAYQVPNGSAGNPSMRIGAVGLDFEVRRPIRVFELGVFDQLGDGIDRESNPVVQLWSRDTNGTPEDVSDDIGHELLESLQFSAGNPGELRAGHRFKPLIRPIELPVGCYSIVAYGLSDLNSLTKSEKRSPIIEFKEDPHWIGANNTASGNNYVWSPRTSHAGGTPGEVGGTFARSQIESSFGDVHLSQTFTLNDSISATGRLHISDVATMDGALFVGHYSSSVADNRREFLGLEVNDGHHQDVIEVRARMYHAQGHFSGGAFSPSMVLPSGRTYEFEYEYDPNFEADQGHDGPEGRIWLHISNKTLSIDRTAVAVLEAGHRHLNVTLDAFGIGTAKGVVSTGDVSKTAQVFVDDVGYSGLRTTEIRGPVDLPKNGPVTPIRVETLRGSIVPRGSRCGDCRPGTFPTMRVDRESGYAAGSFEYSNVGVQ